MNEETINNLQRDLETLIGENNSLRVYFTSSEFFKLNEDGVETFNPKVKQTIEGNNKSLQYVTPVGVHSVRRVYRPSVESFVKYLQRLPSLGAKAVVISPQVNQLTGEANIYTVEKGVGVLIDMVEIFD